MFFHIIVEYAFVLIHINFSFFNSDRSKVFFPTFAPIVDFVFLTFHFVKSIFFTLVPSLVWLDVTQLFVILFSKAFPSQSIVA